MITKYIPCPACHDIGGRGRIEQWEIDGFRIYYVCEECDLAWRDLNGVSWKNAEIFDCLIEHDGYILSEIHLRLIKSPLDLFCVSDEELTLLVNKVIENGELVGKEARGSTYRQLELPFPIGRFGESILVVRTHIFNSSYRLVFPSHKKVEKDFHW